MRFISPLKSKMQRLLTDDSGFPLDQARITFGSQTDYERLGGEIEVLARTGLDPLLIDMVPFHRIGNETALGEVLRSACDRAALTIVAREGPVSESLRSVVSGMRCQVGVYDGSGALRPWAGDTRTDLALQRVREALSSDGTFDRVRRRAAHETLLELLSRGGVVNAFPGCGFPDHDLVDIYGRWYIRMPNRMLVSCYLDVKQALAEQEAMTALSFEVISALYGYFLGAKADRPPCDVLVVPNNTAAVVGACVQAFTGIPLCVVDKLGPIPSKRIADIQTSTELRGRRVSLLLDVCATGGEVDRAIMFLSSRRAEITRIIACYSLEVGKPMLADLSEFVPLCTPKKDLGYAYRSE